MKVKIKMIIGVLGEDGEHWGPGETHEATPGFAAYVVHSSRAVFVGDASEAPKPRAEPQVQTRKRK